MKHFIGKNTDILMPRPPPAATAALETVGTSRLCPHVTCEIDSYICTRLHCASKSLNRDRRKCLHIPIFYQSSSSMSHSS